MHKLFAQFASTTSRLAGSPYTFLICFAAVIVWAISGPAFHYSEAWQMVINTGTTIVTFLMVFLIQNSQNRDGQALQTKLDELIRASDAQDEFMGIEKLNDKELEALHARCTETAEATKRNLDRAKAEREARKARAKEKA
jgi:low affinity Fe/Cu permease